MIGLFDMDNSLFDYSSQLIKDLKSLMSPDEVMPDQLFGDDVPMWIKSRIKLIQSQPGWWRNLPKFKLGWDVYHVADELNFDCHILTKGPWYHPQAWSEKLECIQNHFDYKISIDIVGKSKGGRYGTFLVDDYPPYVEDWLKYRHRGLVIMPAQNYNKDFVHPRVIRYDGTNLDEVKRCLTIVRQRQSGKPLILN